MARWTIRVTPQVRAWLREIAKTNFDTYAVINAAIDELARQGPGLGRPLVDTITGSKIHNLLEGTPTSVGQESLHQNTVCLRSVEPRGATGRR